jgi:transposase
MKPTQKYNARQIAKLYAVSYGTARNWIMKLNGDDAAMGVNKLKGRGKRPYRLRRLDDSQMAELDSLING